MMRPFSYRDGDGVLRTGLNSVKQPRIIDISEKNLKISGYTQIRIVCKNTLECKGQKLDSHLHESIKKLQSRHLVTLCDNRLTVEELSEDLRERYQLGGAKMEFKKNDETLKSSETIQDWVNCMKWKKEPGLYGEVCYSVDLEICAAGGRPPVIPSFSELLESVADKNIKRIVVEIGFEDGTKMVITGQF
ncbi:uncharacterized protein LOC129596135 [Paramacrobiotus metropolitanus]|uniref:uncharacterized protein LOC129596135 n=1 Tax=Paramacrobiotus metropolitanus TaxID=2943436 RepID=UPI00244592A1|nr:uncharacterized protein LOC129596135 [Paramacrobiotus metropolitanus]